MKYQIQALEKGKWVKVGNNHDSHLEATRAWASMISGNRIDTDCVEAIRMVTLANSSFDLKNWWTKDVIDYKDDLE